MKAASVTAVENRTAVSTCVRDIDEPDAVQKACIRGVSAAPAPADRGPPSEKLFSLLSLENTEDVFDDDHR